MTTATIVAFYSDLGTARRVRDELVAEGIDHGSVSVIGVNDATGPVERELADHPIEHVLRKRDVPAPEVERAVEGLRRGGALVIADMPAADHDRALAVIDRHRPGGADRAQENYPEPGWSRHDEVTGPRGALEVADDRLHVKRPGESQDAFRTLAPTPEEMSTKAQDAATAAPVEQAAETRDQTGGKGKPDR
jgi:hypothetical protein